MILQHIQATVEVRSMLLQGCSGGCPPSPTRSKSTDTIKDEKDSLVDYDCVPLDLSVNAGRLSPGLRDSGTESDDSGGRCSPEGPDCKAYKKSLMKRYCKS